MLDDPQIAACLSQIASGTADVDRLVRFNRRCLEFRRSRSGMCLCRHDLPCSIADRNGYRKDQTFCVHKQVVFRQPDLLQENQTSRCVNIPHNVV